MADDRGDVKKLSVKLWNDPLDPLSADPTKCGANPTQCGANPTKCGANPTQCGANPTQCGAG